MGRGECGKRVGAFEKTGGGRVGSKQKILRK